MKMVGVKAVAKACGVSPSTVCRALNGRGDINEKTRDAVLAACARLGFVKSAAAGALRAKRDRLIGCLAPDRCHELFIEKLYHLKRNALENGFRWQLHGYQDTKTLAEAFRLTLETRPSGVVVCENPLGPLELELADKNETALVFFDTDAAPSDRDSVSLDRESGLYDAARALLRNGRRAIALLGYCRPEDARERAWRRAHADLGLAPREDLAFADPWDHDLFAYGYETAKKALAQAEPDAMMVVNDAAAIGAIRAIREAGKTVPGDIAVVGFDNIMAGAYVSPALTTVSQPKEEMARLAIAFLLQRIAHPETPPQRARLKTSRVARESD